jgi:hypothetical protein
MTRGKNLLHQPVISASLLLAVILAFTGAFDTFQVILPLRFAYRLLAISVGAGFLLLFMRLASRTSSLAAARNIIAAFGAAVPATLAVWLLGIVLFSASASLPRLLGLYPAVVVVNGLLIALWRLTERRETIIEVAPAAFVATPDDTVPPALAERLPPRLARSRLLAIEAQDHYLRVLTQDGSALVHMRLADALTALEGSDGARVHRSWWVARCAVDDAEWSGGRGQLTLLEGTTVPVSRTFADAAKTMARRPC